MSLFDCGVSKCKMSWVALLETELSSVEGVVLIFLISVSLVMSCLSQVLKSIAISVQLTVRKMFSTSESCFKYDSLII